tara:strand:+ start:1075 stop:2376 length:1302 start_codon:yes stop_codon:yes gene_type:complete
MNQIDANMNIGRNNDFLQGKSVDNIAQKFSDMDSSLKQIFKKGLAEKLQHFSNALLDSKFSQSSYRNLFQSAEFLLDKLLESHSELVEELVPDLKKLRKQNKNIGFSDYLAAASQFIVSVPKVDSKGLGSTIDTNLSSSLLALDRSSERQVFLRKDYQQSALSLKSNRILNSNSSFISLVMGFEPEDIKALIRSLIENGLETIDDLYTLLQLVGELGLGANSKLMAQVAHVIQSFVEDAASMVSDPAELIRLVQLVREFSQGDLIKDINMDSIGGKLVDLIGGEAYQSQRSLMQDVSASPMLTIAMSVDSSDDDDDDDEKASLIAEQVSGSQNYNKPKDGVGVDQVISDRIEEDHSSKKVTKISKSNLKTRTDKKHIEQEFDRQDDELSESCVSVLDSLKTLIEKNEPIFYEAMLTLLQDVYKCSLSEALDEF